MKLTLPTLERKSMALFQIVSEWPQRCLAKGLFIWWRGTKDGSAEVVDMVSRTG